MDGDRPFWRSGSVLASLGVLVVVVVTDVVMRHRGGTPADFTLFVGRFHPLAVHLPIGVVLLVGAAEVATLSPRFRARLDPAVGLALVPLVLLTAGTFLLGHLLARSGDFAPRALTIHRRAELFACVGICLLPLGWAYQERRATTRARTAYRVLLGVTLFNLSAGAHFGGTLTHGDTYLTHYAPSPLRGLLGASAPKSVPSASSSAKAAEPHLFADVLGPLLFERCAPCHGTEKVKAGLRLDSLDAILKGGESGAVVIPGAPDDSELLRRVLLPEDDDDHMPPEGKRGLTAPEIALVRFWIERGANDRVLARDLLVPPAAQKPLEGLINSAGSTAPHPPAPPSSAPSPPSASPSSVPAPSAATPTSTLPPSTSPSSSSSSPPSSSPSPSPSSSSPAPASRVLREHCEKCHGAEKQKSKLRVDSLDALLAGGKSGPAIVPGNPAQSELMRRLSLPPDDDKHMPPKKEPQLTPAELSALASFIRTLPSSRSAPDPSRRPSSTPNSPPTPSSSPSSPPTPNSPPDSDIAPASSPPP
ncbi:MAG TPA: c-type cytochrome domain-containing protein, partial [Polyangiaceae bacterium]|nr:c-type cytochrome domain-containing protein [Polyangiaceae bacterium]